MAAQVLEFPAQPGVHTEEPEQYLVTPVVHGIPRDDLATLVDVAEPDELTDEPIPYVLTDMGWEYPLD